MDFEKKLMAFMKECTTKELDAFIMSNVKDLFNTAKIYRYYQILHDHQPDVEEVKLVIAWLAQLSGDNMKLGMLSRTLSKDAFSGDYQSFYYDLQALSGLFGDPRERLTYSEKSLDNLSKDQTTFFHGNAYLTRGQIHNGLKEYRSAYQFFYQAYEVFLQEEMMFPASVALTNALLNKARLAQFDECIKIGKQSMLMSSSFSGSNHQYWDVLYLPMGIAYLEQHHVLLAIDYLIKAKEAIDALGLIHMHGYLELYLLKAYKIHGDIKKLKDILMNTKELFSQMRYPIMTLIMKYGDVLHDDYLSNQEIEELKLMYKEDKDPQPFLIELLVYLGIKNHQEYLPFDEFIAYIEKTRSQGDLIQLQVLLLLLADIYYEDKKYEDARVILEEVIRYKEEYKLLGAFYLYPYACWSLIEKMDHSIKNDTNKQPYFTEKELEVLLLMERGASNKEIGEELFISVGTVKWHVNHILSKLYAKNRVQAIHEAKKLGIFKEKQ